MSYRDDLEAAQARADAAEHRAHDLQQELEDAKRDAARARTGKRRDRNDDAEQRVRALQKRVKELERAAASRGEPLVAIPARFEVSTDSGILRIRWRWFRPFEHLILLFFCLAWGIAMIPMYSEAFAASEWLAYVYPAAHLIVGIGLTYSLVAAFMNRTTVTASAGQLAIAHGPLPWRGNRVLQRSDLQQLYVAKLHKARPTWELRAIQQSGKELRLSARLDQLEQGLYLERELERVMKIRDRAVFGEADT